MTDSTIFSKRFLTVSTQVCTFLVLSLIAYWPALFGERIWDDHFLTGQNPFFRSPVLVFEAFRHWLYPFSVSTYFRPVQNVSYMFDYWCWGANYFGFHLTNVLLHTSAALLLSVVVRKIAGVLLPLRPELHHPIACLTAAIWLVHPIHHAAVAYVAGRADSLAAVFALLGWILAERASERVGMMRMMWAIAAFASAGLSLLSKEIGITWIGLFVVYQAVFRPGLDQRKRLGFTGAAIAVVLLYAAYRQTLPDLGQSPVLGATPLTTRIAQALRAFGDYLSIIFLPVNLHMERKLHIPSELLRSSAPWLHYHAAALVPLGIVGAVGCALLSSIKTVRRRFFAFGTAWFLVGFLPISNLFPLNAPVAEHWIYMPSAALIMIVVLCFSSFVTQCARWHWACVGPLVLGCLFMTHQQSRTWVDEDILFRTAINRGGDTARARANLARVLETGGDSVGAEKTLRQALERNPENPVLKVQLVGLLEKSGRAVEALQVSQPAVNSAKPAVRPPVPWMLEAQKVRLLLQQRNYSKAEAVLTAALGDWPSAWDLIYLRALLYGEVEQPQEAAAVLASYVQKNWWHRDAVMALARYLAYLHRYDEAVDKYNLAGRLDIYDSQPWEQIAVIRAQEGRLDEALKAQEQAVRSEARNPEQRERLASLYTAVGREADAYLEMEEAARLRGK